MHARARLFLPLLFFATCTTIPKGERRPAAVQAKEAHACPAKMPLPEHFSARDIRALSEDPSIKTVEDMLACLARDLKLETLLLHTSFAAQNSDSKNPRALLVSAVKRKVAGIFTVNSGEAHLNQNHSVEFMFNNKMRGEAEFYDIDFNEGHAVMSALNPEACMNCHGIASRVPVGGPKMLFDRDPWSRVVHADSGFTPQADASGFGFCTNRRKLHYDLEKQTLNAFRTKPRYRSLTSLPKTTATDFDVMMRDMNSRRIAKWITQTPGYQEYKWAIFATAFSCVANDEVFSSRQIAQMNDVRTLHEDVIQARNSHDLDLFVLRQQTERWKQSLWIDDRNVALLEAVKRNEPVSVGLPDVDTGGQCRKPFDRHEGKENPASRAERITLMERYAKDTEAWGGDLETGVFQYIFESRGMNISDWNTQPTPGYGRGPGMLREYLLDHEKNNGPDYAVLKDAMSRMQFEACPLLLKLAKQRF